MNVNEIQDKQLIERILIEIAKAYPFPLEDVRAAYDYSQSFDNTIKACQVAATMGFTRLYIIGHGLG